MFRYVAMIWDPAASHQSRTATQVDRQLRIKRSNWQELVIGKGCRVLCADGHSGALRPRTMCDGSGLILGSLFQKNAHLEDDAPAREAVLDRSQTASILASEGRALVEHYWGDYIALLRHPVSKKYLIVKSPTGSLPCWITVHQGVVIFFASIGDFVGSALNFTVNWSYVRNRIVTGGLDADQSPLNEASQVFGGECVEVDMQASTERLQRRFYWNPLTFSDSADCIKDPDEARHAMRASVRSSTGALARSHESIVHRLSGGLDSSILLGCLGDAPSQPQITCFTYFDPRGRADERPWARLAAQHVHCKHVEWAYDPARTRLDVIIARTPTIEPPRVLRQLAWSTAERELALESRATAVCSGDGGDSVFGREAIDYALDQYLRLQGLRAEIFRLASQIAVYRDRTVWNVLATSLRRQLVNRRMNDRRQAILSTSRLVNPDIGEAFLRKKSFPHPWLRESEDIPWDVVFQIGGLLLPREFYHPATDAHEPGPQSLTPLLSQPVVETCMRIPIHVRFAGGRDRGLARDAFAKEVPARILHRHWKDRGPGFFGTLLLANLKFIRELLLDGQLVEEGLLNRAAVENALSDAPTKGDLFLGEILEHLAVEVWVRQWTDARQCAVA